MQLHHTSGVPDWQAVPPGERNRWQRLAARTHSFITPGNIISWAGLGIVCGGLALLAGGHTAAGLLVVVLGRAMDLLDGIAADKTGTKSPIGEGMDAGADKLGALAALLVFGLKHFVPWWVIGLVLLQNLANIGIGLLAHRRQIAVHPTAAGKWSTAGEWAAFFCFILGAAYGRGWLWPAYLALTAALLLGTRATVTYRQTVLRASRARRRSR